VPVPPTMGIQVRHASGLDGTTLTPGREAVRSLVAEQQVVGSQRAGADVGHDLGGDLGAELEPPVLLVLRVVLGREPAARWVLLGRYLHDGAADGQDAGGQIQVTNPQLGQLSHRRQVQKYRTVEISTVQ
jgi:hypothetical protein